jgi:hypothetical protein
MNVLDVFNVLVHVVLSLQFKYMEHIQDIHKLRIGTVRIELHEPVHGTLPGHSQAQDRDYKDITT